MTLRTTSPIEITPTTVSATTNRQVSDVSVGHEGHRLFDRQLRRNADDRMGHNLADLNLPGRLPLENHLASVVPLGDDADEPLILHDKQGSDTLLRHLIDGLVDRRVGRQGPDVPTLVVQEIADPLHGETCLAQVNSMDAEPLRQG